MSPIEGGSGTPCVCPAAEEPRTNSFQKTGWKPLAWNGVSMRVPQAWEVTGLDRDYLLLSCGDEPVLEVKWTTAIGRAASLEKVIRRFTRRVSSRLGISITELPAPDFFNTLSRDYHAFYFSWRSGVDTGAGVLVLCRRCRTLTLIRNMGVKNKVDFLFFHDFLSGFRDHSSKGTSDWSLFGFRFSLPGPVRLDRYSFQPGSFMVRLRGKGMVMTRFSWGPASWLLAGKTLELFVRERLPELKQWNEAVFKRKDACCTWEYHPWPRLPFWLPVWRYKAAWAAHDSQENRIYGMVCHSKEKLVSEISGMPEMGHDDI